MISLSHVYRPILHPFSDSGHLDIGTFPGIALLGVNVNVNDRRGGGTTVLEKETAAHYHNKGAGADEEFAGNALPGSGCATCG